MWYWQLGDSDWLTSALRAAPTTVATCVVWQTKLPCAHCIYKHRVYYNVPRYGQATARL